MLAHKPIQYGHTAVTSVMKDNPGTAPAAIKRGAAFMLRAAAVCAVFVIKGSHW